MSINMSQELRDMIQDLEKRYNTKIVDISFIGYRDTKIKWERTSSTIKFFISDYLEGIPDELLAEVLNILLARSLNDESIESSAELNDFFTTSVRLNKKKLYLSRIKGVYKPSKNKHIKIKKIVKELKENKLISEDYEFDVMMQDTDAEGSTTNPDTLATSSRVFRIIFLSSKLDNKDIPDYVLKWLIIQEAARIQHEFVYAGPNTEIGVQKITDQYPLKDVAMKWLAKHDKKVMK